MAGGDCSPRTTRSLAGMDSHCSGRSGVRLKEGRTPGETKDAFAVRSLAGDEATRPPQ